MILFTIVEQGTCLELDKGLHSQQGSQSCICCHNSAKIRHFLSRNSLEIRIRSVIVWEFCASSWCRKLCHSYCGDNFVCRSNLSLGESLSLHLRLPTSIKGENIVRKQTYVVNAKYLSITEIKHLDLNFRCIKEWQSFRESDEIWTHEYISVYYTYMWINFPKETLTTNQFLHILFEFQRNITICFSWVR